RRAVSISYGHLSGWRWDVLGIHVTNYRGAILLPTKKIFFCSVIFVEASYSAVIAVMLFSSISAINYNMVLWSSKGGLGEYVEVNVWDLKCCKRQMSGETPVFFQLVR